MTQARDCPRCGGFAAFNDMGVCDNCGWFPGQYWEEYEAEHHDTEPNPLAWLEELDDDDPLRTGESEWERGIRRGTST